MDKLLRIEQVKLAVGLKTTAIYRLIRVGGFPPSVRIGERAVAWRESDVSAWIDSRTSSAASIPGGEL